MTIYYLLFAIRYSLFAIHYSLFTIHYSLFTVHCSLFTPPQASNSPAITFIELMVRMASLRKPPLIISG